MRLALVGVVLVGLLLLVARQQWALLEAATRCQGASVPPEAAGKRVAEQTRESELQGLLEAAREEASRLRLENQQWERLCMPADPASAAQPGQDQSALGHCPSVAAAACEAQTFYMPPNEPLSEMTFVVAYLRNAGWRQVADSEVAAFVLSTGEGPPEKRPCGGDFQGTRLSGQFAKELEMCQKHKTFTSLATYLSSGLPGSAETVTPEELQGAFPWLPRTYLLGQKSHVAALNASLPCEGALTTSFIVKGDVHGGRAVWVPESGQEIRALVGLPCPGAPAVTAEAPEYPPVLVQELIKSASWVGATIMARVFLLVVRRGSTRFSAERGRWSLGVQAPIYELHIYDTALFTQYPGRVRDSASEEMVTRRNASELEEFVQAELARRGQPKRLDWVEGYFMEEAGRIATASFAASSTPWVWDQPTNDVAGSRDGLKASSLEPDGSYMFIAQELMLDADLRVRLIEYTCIPADFHGLQAQFDHLPWTRVFADDMGRQLAQILLRSSGQDLGAAIESDSDRSRWRRLGVRGPFPHP